MGETRAENLRTDHNNFVLYIILYYNLLFHYDKLMKVKFLDPFYIGKKNCQHVKMIVNFKSWICWRLEKISSKKFYTWSNKQVYIKLYAELPKRRMRRSSKWLLSKGGKV